MENEVMSRPMIECDNLVKIYKTKDIEVLALQGLDVRIDQRELMAIIGNSGSGKSTFLNMIGGLDRPSAGKLIVDGKDLFKLNERELVEYKRSTVGFVWQNNARNLLPYLTAWQNVQMPMLFESGAKKKQRALELLEMVGMSHRKNSRLDQLSGEPLSHPCSRRRSDPRPRIQLPSAARRRRCGRGSWCELCSSELPTGVPDHRHSA